MLPQTKRTVAALKEAGLTRKQFKVKTPWKPSINDYGDTTIVVLCSYTQIAPYAQKLAKSFKVVVTLLDGVACDVSLKTATEPGLYKLEHGQEVQVSSIEYSGSYEQLVLWEAS